MIENKTLNNSGWYARIIDQNHVDTDFLQGL
jgi:hypothetical protein